MDWKESDMHDRVAYKRTECEPSQFGSSREQSSRDKGSSSVFRKCMSTVNWNMFRMCMSIVDWNSSPPFLAPPLPSNKAGWAFTENCSGIINNNHFIGTCP